MFRRLIRDKQDEPVDRLVTDVAAKMQQVGIDSAEYPKLMTYLERLYKVKRHVRNDTVSRDTVAIIVGNLVGILLIVAYEQKHVLTSKGFNQLIRPKASL